MTDHDIALCRRWAGFYRSRGYNPLPSRPDAKRPFCRFAEYWDEPAPESLFDRFPTSNVQLMTGYYWRLMVLDLDGPEALAWLAGKPLPPTWITHSGGGGRHIWFSLPSGIGRELPRAVLWQGEGSHSAVERLCEHSLILAPPSIHPETGERYRFLDKRHSPASLPLPAVCPDWILAAKGIEKAQSAPEIPKVLPKFPKCSRKSGHYRAADVLAAIPNKVTVARDWGLRLTGRRAGPGCLQCRAIGREDRHPSAFLVEATGRYWDPWLEDGRSISLFELGAKLGIYRDWREAVSDLGQQYAFQEISA